MDRANALVALASLFLSGFLPIGLPDPVAWTSIGAIAGYGAGRRVCFTRWRDHGTLP